MARKARQRISYVLPLANSPGGHLLGVNSLAVDQEDGVLYSAGRDGLICSWKLGVDLKDNTIRVDGPVRRAPVPSTFQSQAQAHTHWVNDIVLAKNNECLVSCSSDLTVKLWRPKSSPDELPQTIGHHSDYVKCLVAPRDGSDWVASGGLDRKIRLWDLHGKGETLAIDMNDEGNNPKGSVYALAMGGSILASGGPESVVRIWDPRSGKRVTKFVGHTDNIRAILVSDAGDHILTASSDTTIKMWSLTGGRCLHTLTMHNDSVWSLFSSHPRLDIFHSSDRTGLVAKTDLRNVKEIDEGICVAVCQEREGVRKVIAAGDYIWTTTSSSNIKRWMDVDTNTEIAAPSSPVLTTRPHASSIGSRHRINASPMGSPSLGSPTTIGPKRPTIPINAILRLSTTSPLLTSVRDPDAVTVHSVTSARQASISETILDNDPGITVPVDEAPDEIIEGQHGLIKHFLLNDRRRVLTLDTAGVVLLWDLVKCVPTKSFGKRDLEDVAAEINTVESAANWCQVDTRTGRLACVLEENYCFDAEMYADEVEADEPFEFREDQRINLGKWVLRYLFANLIDEEIRRDEAYRETLKLKLKEKEAFRRANAPPQITLPPNIYSSIDNATTPGSTKVTIFPQTPMMIGLATPALAYNPTGVAPHEQLPATVEEVTPEVPPTGGRPSMQASGRASLDPGSAIGDYFTSGNNQPKTPTATTATATTPGEGAESTPASPSAETSEAAGGGLFGKFRSSFGSKKINRSMSTDAGKAAAEEKLPTADAEAAAPEIIDDTLGGVITRLRVFYDSPPQDINTNMEDVLKCKITPSLPSETPTLNLPPATAIIIQEDKPDSGGVADLYRGTVACVGEEADLLEKKAPAWLGDVLLLNKVPLKDTVKVSFVLQPWNDLLPPISNGAADGNSRLNANRMLRAKKILTYVAERLTAPHLPDVPEDKEPPKPEDWLEVLCHEQVVPINQTLATIRSHVWKSGGDVMLMYRKKNWNEKQEEKKADGEGEGKGEEANVPAADDTKNTTNAANDTPSTANGTMEGGLPAPAPAPVPTTDIQNAIDG